MIVETNFVRSAGHVNLHEDNPPPPETPFTPNAITLPTALILADQRRLTLLEKIKRVISCVIL